MRRTAMVFMLVAAFTAVSDARQTASDVTQWRGPNRDGIVPGFKAPSAWPEQLTQRWKVDVGLGYATPLVVGNSVFVFSRQNDDEVMIALDAASGKVLWRSAHPAPFEMNSAAAPHNKGPKSTPVYANARLFAIGMTGVVVAYDAATGKRLWEKPGSMPVPTYTTHSFSPIIEGGTVIFHVGGHMEGALTAFDVATGDVRWRWGGDGPGYGSPIIVDFGGVRQLVTITQGKLIGVNPSTGALLWERPYASTNFTNSITPVRLGDMLIYWGSGTNAPMLAVRVTRQNNQWSVEQVWENPDLPGRFSNAVLEGDVMFGLTGRNSGQYYAVDAKSGKTLWTSEGRQASNAAIARVGDILVSLENDGELVILRTSRAGFEPIRRYRVAAEETFSAWAQPALSGNRIFVKDLTTVALWTID